MDKASQKSAGFSLFAFTWALACLFHQLQFADWRWYSIHGVALTCALLAVLYKPSSWQRFTAFLIVDWLSVAYEFPTHPNHIVFSWVVNATILTSLVIVVSKNKGISGSGLESKWHEAFAPWVRVELCLLYFFTVFHKLNVSYFNPEWSCAAKLHHEIHERFLFLPDDKWALYAAIYGTLIIETAIPVSLSFRRTRFAGIILGLLFHGLLALHPYMGLISFSSTMPALYTVFLPLSMASALQPGNEIRKVWRWGILAAAPLLLLWTLHSLLPSLNLERFVAQSWKAGFIGYFVYLIFAFTMVIRAQKKERLSTQHMVGYWKAHRALLIFPLILIINGFGPYYGLKTQTSFSMFSNLHTEQGISNHLIVPSGLHITNWQYDVVEIIDSNEPDLIFAHDNALLVVYLELRRMRTDAREDFWVTFRRNGGPVETFDMKRPETYDVLTPLGPLAKRYFMFRHLEQDPLHVLCQQ